MIKIVKGTIGTEVYRTDIQVRDHELISDEPVDSGGKDMGPSPTEYMCAALVACKTITMRMYADRKGWGLESADVTVSHERVKADDLELADGRKGLISLFKTTIELKGELSESEKGRLVEIASRCPVHRSLENGAVIRTEHSSASVDNSGPSDG